MSVHKHRAEKNFSVTHRVVDDAILKMHLKISDHRDGFRWGQHVPQPIRAEDQASMTSWLHSHHTDVWVRRHHKLPLVVVVAPQVPYNTIQQASLSSTVKTQTVHCSSCSSTGPLQHNQTCVITIYCQNKNGANCISCSKGPLQHLNHAAVPPTIKHKIMPPVYCLHVNHVSKFH